MRFSTSTLPIALLALTASAQDASQIAAQASSLLAGAGITALPTNLAGVSSVAAQLGTENPAALSSLASAAATILPSGFAASVTSEVGALETNSAAASSVIAALPSSQRAMASSEIASLRAAQSTAATSASASGMGNGGIAVQVPGNGLALSGVVAALFAGAAVLL